MPSNPNWSPEMSTISKTTYTFAVLHRSDEPPPTMGDAMREATDGHAVGNVVSEHTVPVPDASVEAELVVMGNDGSFFEDDLGPGELPFAVVEIIDADGRPLERGRVLARFQDTGHASDFLSTIEDRRGRVAAGHYAIDGPEWVRDVDPLVDPCSVCGATAYTVVDNEPRCPAHLNTELES
jgi:hypothetical protein